VNAAPEHLCFDYNCYGKPFLASEFEHYQLTFNLSHSDGLALYAIVRNQYVGIDIERIRTDFEYEEIAQRFFSPREVAVLRTVPAHLKPEAFFSCWTRKEAYIKAQGQGLSLPLDSFDVSLAPGEPAKLLSTRDGPQEASRWALLTLNPGQDYTGTVAVKQRNYKGEF
jgi:4'-phosphopantetheinyl transferase